MKDNSVCCQLALGSHSLLMFMDTPEELLIDFQELAGEHSGENMAEAAWEMMNQYNLIS